MYDQSCVTRLSSAPLTCELASRACDLSPTCVHVHLGCLLRLMPTLSHSQLDCSRRALCNIQQKAASV